MQDSSGALYIREESALRPPGTQRRPPTWAANTPQLCSGKSVERVSRGEALGKREAAPEENRGSHRVQCIFSRTDSHSARPALTVCGGSLTVGSAGKGLNTEEAADSKAGICNHWWTNQTQG